MEHYKIAIMKGTASIEISSHDKEWVEKKEKEYKDFLSQPDLVEGQKRKFEKRDIGIKTDDGQIPINEFYRKYIHEQKINSRPEIATFFVYYLSKVKKQSDISSTEIKNLFRDVQYPGWNKINIADVLNKAKKKALLNNFENQWSLTITGEDYVLNNLSE